MERIFATLLIGALSAASLVAASTPNPALLVLDKRDNSLAIVDPETLQVVGRAPAGPDPHEVVASADGRLAYISNYGGLGSSLHTLSVVDLVNKKALPPIDLGVLHSAHGLAFAEGHVYFTAETNKVIGRYDPSVSKIDWVLGIGQDRTHMIVVRGSAKQIFTSNVNSGTISVIEETLATGPPPGVAGAGPPASAPGPGRLPPGDRQRKDWSEVAIKVGVGPEGFDISPDGKEIWAANSHDGTVSVIEVASKKMIQTIDAHVEFSNRLKFTADGRKVLISSLRSGDLAIFDASARREIKRIKVGHGAAGILIQPDDARAYVSCSPDDNVAVIDLKTLSISNRVQPGHEPDGLAWAVRQ